MNHTTCTITGHRTQRFKFKYNEHYTLCKKIKKALCTEIKNLYAQGIRTFWVGGAMGVDTWAAEIILELKKQPKYADVLLCIALPYPGVKERYDARQQTRLRDILRACDKQVMTSEQESEKAYRIRNEYMVNQAYTLLAVYDNDRSIRSGTSMTVNYAKKKGLSIILIHPDTAAVDASSL